MAITRAQQFRQMLIKGGVANPDGRRGFFQGALDDAREKNQPISPGTSVGGNTRGGTGKGRDLDVQQRGMTKSEYNRRVAEGTINRYRGSDDPPKPPQLREDKSFVPTPVPKGISPIERFRNDQIQKSINRNKVLALRKLGLLPKPSISPIGAIFQSFEQIPEEFELMSEEDLLKIATSGPYLSQQKTVGDVNRFTSGKDLLGRTFEAEDILRKGDMTQSKFEELFPGPDIPDDRGPDQQETDPCKGPNPPAYCFVGGNVPPPSDDDQDPTGGLAFRFMSRGGSPMDAPTEGGVMDLETGRQMYFLGKLVKKASRAVKKIVKSPIGKAAILGGAMYFGKNPGTLSKFFGTGTLNPFKQKISGVGTVSSGLGKLLSKVGLTDFVTGDLTTFGKFGIPFALLPFLTEDEQEQLISSRGKSFNIGETRDNPYTFASQVGSGSGIARAFSADGGRIGLKDGLSPALKQRMLELLKQGVPLDKLQEEAESQLLQDQFFEMRTGTGPGPLLEAKEGGRIGYQEGSKEPVAKKTMPLLDMDGKEMDLRDNGGFVPIGRMEKADDVPARLSKNEFVFTADAVRNAGGGDVDKGAEVMYNMMKNLESGGEVSEESQGLEGAREMFQTSKRLEEVL